MKLLFTIFIAVLLANYSFAQAPQLMQETIPTTYDDWLKKGMQQARNKEFKSAVLSFAECIKLKPTIAKLYLLKAEANFSATDTVAAEIDYTNMVKTFQTNDSVIFSRANFLLRINKLEAAIADYTTVINHNAPILTSWLNRGAAYAKQKKYNKAVEDFSFILTKNTNHVNAYKMRAETYCKMGEREKAWADEYKVYELGSYVTTPCSKWLTENGEGSNLFLFRTKDFKYGFVNTIGKVVVTPIYKMANDFAEGYASVCKEVNGKEFWGFIDATGKEVIPCKYGKVYSFSEGLAMVSDSSTYNAKFGFINYAGKEVIKQLYDFNIEESHNGFFEGVAILSTKFKSGGINKQGETVIPFLFDRCSNFSEGLATITEGYQSIKSIINHKGEKTHTSSYKHINGFNEGLSVVCTDFVGIGGIRTGNGREGFIDRNGKTIIGAQYITAYDFSEGLAAVCNATDLKLLNKFGFINNMGKVVIPFAYKTVSSFSNGLAKVTDASGKSFFINKMGNKVFDVENVSQYSWTQFKNGFALIEHTDGTNSLINTTGKLIAKF